MAFRNTRNYYAISYGIYFLAVKWKYGMDMLAIVSEVFIGREAVMAAANAQLPSVQLCYVSKRSLRHEGHLGANDWL